MYWDNYFRRQTTSENETRVQIEAAQENFTNIEEAEVPDVLQNACKNNNYQAKHKLGKCLKPNTFSIDNEV